METIEYGYQNVDWVATGVKFLMGLLGIAVYVVWKVREHLNDFDFGRLIRENQKFWIWSFTMHVLVLTIITISPDTAGAIKTMIGLDVKNEPASFLLLGWGLSSLSNAVSKKKLNKKE